MPRGDKSKYTEKQRRQAQRVGRGYEDRGLTETDAARRGVGHGQQDDRRREKRGRFRTRQADERRPGKERRASEVPTRPHAAKPSDRLRLARRRKRRKRNHAAAGR